MKDLKPFIYRVSFFDEPEVLLYDVIQILDLEDFDQPEPTVQNQQDIHIPQSGEICPAFVDYHPVGEAVVPDCTAEECGCRRLIPAF